jgi:hypothetical protein
MSLSPKSNQTKLNNTRNRNFVKNGLITIGVLLFIQQFFNFSPDSHQSQHGRGEAPESKVKNTISKQKHLYAIRGEFSTDINNYLTEEDKLLDGYRMKIKSINNKLILSVSYAPKANLEQTAFGIIKVLRSKQLPSDKKVREGIEWQYLETLSFICSPKQPGTSLPSDIELTNVSDKCPVGYTQSSIKQDKIHHHKTTDGVAKSDSFGKV